MQPAILMGCCTCSRYDYEGVDSGDAGKVMDHVRSIIADVKPGSKLGPFTLKLADDFSYTDPVDGSVASKQGLRFIFDDGSRIIFRLSGTGSAGATIRRALNESLWDESSLDESLWEISDHRPLGLVAHAP